MNIPEIKKALTEATPGPWHADAFGNVTTHGERKGLRKLLPTTGIIAKCQQVWQGRDAADAKAIALLRTHGDELVRLAEIGQEYEDGMQSLHDAGAHEQ